MQQALKSMLKKHAVRIRRNDETIGSGFLIVPSCGSDAYILTAAHVLFGNSKDIKVQLMGNQDQTVNIAEDRIILHEEYDHSQSKQTVQYCDVALIRLEKEAWMNSVSQIFWGEPVDGMPIQAVGFTVENNDPELIHSSIFPETAIRAYTPATHRISATLRGDFNLNYADMDKDMSGMSGTVFAAQGQKIIIIVGMMISSTGENAVLGQMNLVDVTGVRALLEAQGVSLMEGRICDANLQSTIGMAIAVPQQQIHTEEVLLKAFIKACQNLQNDPSYRHSGEDDRNERIFNDLRLMGYNARLRSPMGRSLSGKQKGEVDIDVRDSLDNPWTICEAMRYRSRPHMHWESYLIRLLDHYNPHFLPFLIFLSYVEVQKERFAKVASNIREHISCFDPKPFEYVQGSLEEYTRFSFGKDPSIQVLKCRYQNDGYSPTVYHILVYFECD